MRPARPAALLLLATALAAQSVDPWRYVADLRIAGATAFTPDAIRLALCADAGAIAELAGSADDAARDLAMRQLIVDGYRRAGFAAVAVTVERSGEGVAVTVREGRCCRAGELRLSGNKELPAEALRKALAEPRGETWPGWPPSGPPACDQLARMAALQIASRAYADAGRYGATFRASFDVHDDVADLVVAVLDEGTLTRVGELDIDGENAADLAFVRDRVHVAKDAVLDLATVRSLRTQLEALGRYTSIDLPSPDQIADAVAPQLSVRVRVAPFAPPTASTPWADIERVRAGIAKMQEHLHTHRIDVTMTVGEPQAALGLTLLPGPVRLSVAADGCALHAEKLRLPDGATVAADLLVGRTGTFLQLGDGNCGWWPGEIGAQVTLATSPDADGGMQVHWGIYFGSAATGAVDVRIHPVTATALLARNVVHLDGDDLVLPFGGNALRLDSAGHLHGEGNDDSQPRIAFNEATVTDALAELRRPFDAAHTMPLSSYLLGLAATHGPAALAAASDAQRDAFALLRSAARWRPTTAFKPSPRFTLRTNRSNENSWLDGIAAALAGHVPIDSWAATLLLSQRDLLGRRPPVATLRRVNALAKNDAAGPLAQGCAALLLAAAGYDELAADHRRVAAARWNTAAAFADLRALLAPQSPLRSLAEQLAAHWRGDEATAPLFAPLPEGADALDVLALAFSRLWDAGLSSWLRDELLGGG